MSPEHKKSSDDKFSRSESGEEYFSQELNLPEGLPVELTEELSTLETQLHGFAPVASAVDRDALMYQAGWDAAKLQARGSVRLFLPSVTAALAAALLFFLLAPPTPPASSLQRAGIDFQTQTLSPPSPATSTSPAHSQNPPPTQPPTHPQKKHPTLTPFPSQKTFPTHRFRHYSAHAPFLALREQALRPGFDRLDFKITSTNTYTGDYSPRPELTRRQMLQEFLPPTDKNTPTRQRLFRWPTWNLGETS